MNAKSRVALSVVLLAVATAASAEADSTTGSVPVKSYIVQVAATTPAQASTVKSAKSEKQFSAFLKNLTAQSGA